MGRLVLLVSYPKSGNTWVRAFLTSLWRDGAEVDINHLSIPNAASRDFIDSTLGLATADLPDPYTAGLRPEIYQYASRQREGEKRIFLKVHDALLAPAPSVPRPLSLESVDRIAYIVRDPRDVVPSLSRHVGQPIEEAIRMLGDEFCTLAMYPGRSGPCVPQFLSSWSAHVQSWLAVSDVPVKMFRYEDLLQQPESSFATLVDFLKIRRPESAIRGALEATRFGVLREKEQALGFVEKPRDGYSFFHGGTSGNWRAELTADQASRIVARHQRTMRELNYLDADG